VGFDFEGERRLKQHLLSTIRRLLRDCGLETGAEGQKRTLYCLRHTYELIRLLREAGCRFEHI